MDVFAFKCPICLQAFNPPVFKCKFGHLGYGRCVAKHPGNRYKQCDQSVIDAVVSAPLIEDHMIECPNVSCRRLVASNEAHNHYIACPQGPCACTEPGCDFTGRLQDLLSHLGVSHSMLELIFRDGEPAWCSMEAPVQPQGCTFIFGFEDGGVFIMVARSLGPATVVSFLCVRSAACLCPRYTVEVLAIGPPSPAGTTDLSADKDTLKAVMEPPSTATPGAFTFNQLMSFLAVPPRYVVEDRPYKVLSLCVCIKKKIISQSLSSDTNSNAFIEEKNSNAMP